MKNSIPALTYGLAALGLLTNAYFMLANGEPGTLWWWPLALVFFAWTAVPFVGASIGIKFLAMGMISKIIFLLTTLVIAVGGIYILVEVFITHLDPQSGIVFIFLPLYQCVVIAIGTGLALLVRKIENNPNHRTHSITASGGSE